MNGTYSNMGALSYQMPVEGTVDPLRSSDVKVMVAEREDQEIDKNMGVGISSSWDRWQSKGKLGRIKGIM